MLVIVLLFLAGVVTVLEEGRQKGLQEGEKRGIEKGMQKGYVRLLRKIVPLLQSAGIPIAPVLNLAGVTWSELEGQQEEDDSEPQELPHP